jgi:sulfur-oxidizing protein SoxY
MTDAGKATRRVILGGAVAGVAVAGVAGLGIGGCLSSPAVAEGAAADAPGWPADAFRQKDEAGVLKTLYAGRTVEVSDQVRLEAPEIAENGAVVPVSVASTLPDVTSISILVLENPYTLAASYTLGPGVTAAVANRLKMAKTTNVVALVEAGGKLYGAGREVKVTVGGCGG